MRLRTLFARLAALFASRRLDRELDGEIEAHLELAERDAIAAGLSPAEARAAARRSLGNRTLVMEEAHEMSLMNIFESIGRDLRHGLRSIRMYSRYSALIVLTLAICIGANTAIFSAVYGVLLRPLPVPNANEIILMANSYPKAVSGEMSWSSGGDYTGRRRAVTALRDQAMFNNTFRVLETGTSAERLIGMVVTPSWFKLVRVRPVHGRTFDESEGEIGNEFKVVLSHSLWQRLFGGDPRAIGRDIRLSGRAFTVIGVMPEKFVFYNPEALFWIPLALTPEQKEGLHSNNWFNAGRLKPGATLQQVQSQVNALNAANLDRFPAMRQIVINAGFETKVMPFKDYVVRDIKGSLRLLWGGAGLLLLIGALNAAGLVVARTSVRTKEMGTRLALGAGLGRLANQIITENLVLSFLGGALGLVLAYALVRSLAVTGLDLLPRSGEVRIDGVVALFALALSILAGLIVALFSVGYLARLRITGALSGYSRGATGGLGTGALRKGLVVAQVSLTFVLLSGAALMLASFRELVRVQPGYETAGILTAATSVPASRYPGAAELNALMARSLAAIRALPGVVSAGATTAIPLAQTYNDGVIFAEGYQMKPGESVISPIYGAVTPGYFQAMGIRLLGGRDFDDRDTQNALRAIIVDKRLAERFWPGRDPVGRRMYQPSGPDLVRIDANTRWLTVVGVVDAARMQNLAGTGNENGVYYFPFAQLNRRNFTFAVKTSGDPASLAPAVRNAMAQVDPSLALFDVRTMSERAASSLAARKAALTLSLGFGTISLFLAAIGLYGVLSYLLAQRRREVGIRMAVGSTPARIFRLFVREGAVLVGIGLATGAGVALVAKGAVERFLYGVRPLEPSVLVGVTIVLAAVAFLAVAWPARQAARVEPVEAIRAEG